MNKKVVDVLTALETKDDADIVIFLVSDGSNDDGSCTLEDVTDSINGVPSTAEVMNKITGILDLIIIDVGEVMMAGSTVLDARDNPAEGVLLVMNIRGVAMGCMGWGIPLASEAVGKFLKHRLLLENLGLLVFSKKHFADSITSSKVIDIFSKTASSRSEVGALGGDIF